MTKLRCCMYSDPAQGRIINGVVNRYGYSVHNGEKVFGKIGEIDAQADIDSFLDSCDYRLIMDALIKQNGCDYDFDEVRTLISSIDMSDPVAVASYMELLQEEFLSLPKEIKEHYANNPRQFARDCISGGAIDFINTFTVVNNGDEAGSEAAGEMATKQSGVAAGNGQPDIAGIMRQIDAINQKLSGNAAPGCNSGEQERG